MIIHSQQQNQSQQEYVYTWYPDVNCSDENNNHLNSREISIQNGLDKDLLDDKLSTTNTLTSVHNNRNTNVELLQRYKQSIAPSERAYHSAETIDEALSPPWALHYQIQRRPATPNLPLDSNEMPNKGEPIRRLKSAPVARSFSTAAALIIPEPRFANAVVPVPTVSSLSSPFTRPKIHTSSAKACLNTTAPISSSTRSRRDAKSAHLLHRKDPNGKLSDNDVQEILEHVYGKEIPQQHQATTPSVEIIYTQTQQPTRPPSPTVYVYQKSATWCREESPTAKSPIRKTIDATTVPLNPHYLHRPGVIAVNNVAKKIIVEQTSTNKKNTKRHHHHRRYHSQNKRNEPLLAMTPIQSKSHLCLEIAGVKLAYDPKLTLNDQSSHITKYFIDGRLYLIKDQRYNVIHNVDSSHIKQDYNQSLTLSQRPKYYRTIPIEKFDIPKPISNIHHNASETYFYNTIPKRVPRYVIDPNFISEDINTNRMSMSKRAPTATVYA